jgi:hypothetical protein
MKTIVNIDRIEKIYVMDEGLSLLNHYIEPVDEKYILFGLIRIQKKEESRWHANCYTYNSREDLVKKNEEFYVDYSAPIKISIWKKPRICIVMPYGVSDVNVYYDSKEQRDIAVNELIKKSNNKLTVVKK